MSISVSASVSASMPMYISMSISLPMFIYALDIYSQCDTEYFLIFRKTYSMQRCITLG